MHCSTLRFLEVLLLVLLWSLSVEYLFFTAPPFCFFSSQRNVRMPVIRTQFEATPKMPLISTTMPNRGQLAASAPNPAPPALPPKRARSKTTSVRSTTRSLQSESSQLPKPLVPEETGQTRRDVPPPLPPKQRATVCV